MEKKNNNTVEQCLKNVNCDENPGKKQLSDSDTENIAGGEVVLHSDSYKGLYYTSNLVHPNLSSPAVFYVVDHGDEEAKRLATEEDAQRAKSPKFGRSGIVPKRY